MRVSFPRIADTSVTPRYGSGMLTQKALVIGRVLLFWVGTMTALALSGPVAREAGNAAVLIGVLTVPATFALTLLFARWEGKRPRDFGFEVVRSSWIRFCAGLVLGLLLVVMQTAIMWLGGGVRWVTTSPAPAMLVPVLGYLLLATREELAFRGYPLRMLASEFNPWVAQAIVATLFVVEHKVGGATWQNAVFGAGVGSLVFGMAALATRGLALPIGLHAAWNVGDWARGGKGKGGLWSAVVDSSSAAHVQEVAMGSYVAVMLCALAGLWLSQRAFQKPVD